MKKSKIYRGLTLKNKDLNIKKLTDTLNYY